MTMVLKRKLEKTFTNIMVFPFTHGFPTFLLGSSAEALGALAEETYISTGRHLALKKKLDSWAKKTFIVLGSLSFPYYRWLKRS